MIPKRILEKLETAAAGIFYGQVVLCIEKKQGKSRYIIRQEESYLEDGTVDSSMREKNDR